MLYGKQELKVLIWMILTHTVPFANSPECFVSQTLSKKRVKVTLGQSANQEMFAQFFSNIHTEIFTFSFYMEMFKHTHKLRE